MSADVLLDHYQCPDGYGASLPFDTGEVIDNLRLERYMNGRSRHRVWRGIARKIYYGLRPLMSVGFRKHLQRAYLNGWQDITFPHWPLDRTVECIFESLATLALEIRGETELPFVWFWPNEYSG